MAAWIRGPLGLDAERWVTRADCRTVLVVVPHVAAGSRLLDLATLLEHDHRVQLVFTVPETPETWQGTDEFVRRHGGLVIPWQQALQHRFALVLAASYTQLEWVRGPSLVVAHGASNLMSRRTNQIAGSGALPHTGLARETLVSKGRVIPTVIALTHDAEVTALRASCPEAVPRANVVGDLCLDRMLASMPARRHYRRILGVRSGQQLVTVSSSWSSTSTFGRQPRLCQRLLAELPRARYRVALVLHPNIWAVHGRRQVEAWLADSLGQGLLMLPPDEGWRAVMVASDWVLGDHGSTTQYAAAIGRRVMLAAFPDGEIRRGSIADALAGVAPRLNLDEPLSRQLQHAEPQLGRADGRIGGLVSSRPGRAAALLRRAMYRVLQLPEPAEPAPARQVPEPRPIRPCAGERWWS
jgi:hypothetical protein